MSIVASRIVHTVLALLVYLARTPHTLTMSTESLQIAYMPVLMALMPTISLKIVQIVLVIVKPV